MSSADTGVIDVAAAHGLTAEELRQFHEVGYVKKEGVISKEAIADLAAAVSSEVDETLRGLVRRGDLAPEHLFPDAPFETRLGLAAHALPDSSAKAALINRFMGRSAADPLTPKTLPMVQHEPFRACLESILGRVVIGGTDTPVRAKIPLDPMLAREQPGQCRTPWHQDAIFRTNTDCDNYMSVQVWIPLVDATVQNGCLHFIPYRFDEGLLPHHVGGGFLGIHPVDMPHDRAPVAVEAAAGDVVLWSNMTPHASFHNHGDVVRWSMDWRFYSADKPNNVEAKDELPTDFSERGKPPTERTVLACSFPSADFVLLDRENPERYAGPALTKAAGTTGTVLVVATLSELIAHTCLDVCARSRCVECDACTCA
jgi:phytanoyl-CoA hydroxylase